MKLQQVLYKFYKIEYPICTSIKWHMYTSVIYALSKSMKWLTLFLTTSTYNGPAQLSSFHPGHPAVHWPPTTDSESVAKSTLKDNLFLHTKGQAFIHIHHTFANYPAFLSPIQTSENLYLDMVLIFNPQSIKTRNTSDFSFPSLEAFKYISTHWELDFLTISQEKVKDHLRYISQMYFLFEL